jgi:hypothetical protein
LSTKSAARRNSVWPPQLILPAVAYIQKPVVPHGRAPEEAVCEVDHSFSVLTRRISQVLPVNIL